MAITLKQAGVDSTTNIRVSGSANQSSPSMFWGSNTTLGSLLVYIAHADAAISGGTIGIVTPPATSGLTWVQAGATLQSASKLVALYYSLNSPVITTATSNGGVAFSNAVAGAMCVSGTMYEFAGLSTGLYDAQSAGNNGSATIPGAGSITTAATGELIISAYVGDRAATTINLQTAGTGYTLGVNKSQANYSGSHSYGYAEEYNLNAASGVQTPVFGSSQASTAWVCSAWAFNPSSGAVSQYLMMMGIGS